MCNYKWMCKHNVAKNKLIHGKARLMKLNIDFRSMVGGSHNMNEDFYPTYIPPLQHTLRFFGAGCPNAESGEIETLFHFIQE